MAAEVTTSSIGANDQCASCQVTH